MILTCPECATGYFVEDGQIRPGGRSVRCASCGARWMAYPEVPLDLISNPHEGALAHEPAGEPESMSQLTGEDLPRVFRSRADNEKRLRRAAVVGAIWAGVAVVVLALLGAAVIYRVAVVQAWPRTATAYAAIGLPVNRVGLVIEGVRAEPSLQEGHAALSVSGIIRNVEDHAVTSPPLRISLYNAQGKRVAGQIAVPADPRIPPGETRHFAIALLDPPFSAQDLQVDFAVDGKGVPAPTHVAKPLAPPPPPGLALRGSASPELAAPPADNALAAPASALPPAPASNNVPPNG